MKTNHTKDELNPDLVPIADTKRTKDEQSEVRGIEDLIKRLKIKAGVIQMGERIDYGSDYNLMYEAAETLQHLQEQHETQMRELVEDIRLLIAKHGRSEDFDVEGDDPDYWVNEWTKKLLPNVKNQTFLNRDRYIKYAATLIENHYCDRRR